MSTSGNTVTLDELGKWLQTLCEKHRRAVLAQCGLHKATDKGVPRERVMEILEGLGYTYDVGSNHWIL